MARKKEMEQTQEQEIKPLETIQSPIQSGMSDMTKGMIIGSVITALVAAIIILLILGSTDNSTKAGSTNTIDTETSSDTYKAFYTYFEKDEPTLIIFASSQCGYCSYQKPVIESIGEKFDLDYLYLDYLTLSSDDEVNAIIEALGIEGATPTSVIVQNGEVLSVNSGFIEAEEYVEFLVNGGILPEGTTYDSLTTIDYSTFKTLLKGKTTSVILFDQYTSGLESSLEAREIVDTIAQKYGIQAYYFPASFSSTDDMNEFIESMGDWGYSTDAYEEDQSISIPLLMFVKNGKIIAHQVDTLDEESALSLFKKAKLVK